MQISSMYTCNIVLHKCVDNRIYPKKHEEQLTLKRENLTQFKGNLAKTPKTKLSPFYQQTSTPTVKYPRFPTLG